MNELFAADNQVGRSWEDVIYTDGILWYTFHTSVRSKYIKTNVSRILNPPKLIVIDRVENV